MPTKSKNNMAPQQVIRQLLSQAEAAFKNDRRLEPRFPFFCSISIQVDGHSYSAFTREISATSIGLLHNGELPLIEVEIAVPNESGQRNNLHVRLERCEPCGDGWYLSGGTFVGLGGDDA